MKSELKFTIWLLVSLGIQVVMIKLLGFKKSDSWDVSILMIVPIIPASYYTIIEGSYRFLIFASLLLVVYNVLFFHNRTIFYSQTPEWELIMVLSAAFSLPVIFLVAMMTFFAKHAERHKQRLKAEGSASTQS